MRNEKGLGMIELMIAVAVGGICAAAFVDMMLYGFNGANSALASYNLDTLVFNANQNLQSDLACDASLAGASLVPLPAGKKMGDAGTGYPISTIFQADGVTHLADAGSTYLGVANLQFILYDLGPVDSLPPYDVEHVAALYISGTRPGVPNIPAFISYSVIYMWVDVVAPNNVTPPNAFYYCPTGQTGLPGATTGFLAGGTAITGSWMQIRVGDSITNPTPRAGTIDVYEGTGNVSNPATAVVSPPYVGAVNPTTFFYQLSNSSWTGAAFKVW